jgi:mRNA interferase MazF
MVTPSRGEIWWADLGEPRGAEPGYLRPVLIVQDDHFNRSNLATIIVLAMTSNQKYADVPGNVFLPKEQTGLARDSVANTTQLAAIDKVWLTDYIARLPRHLMREVERGLTLVLGLK